MIKNNDDEKNEDEFYMLSPTTESFLLKTRRIYLFGIISEQMVNTVIPLMQIMSMTRDPIFIYVNSSGGEVDAGYSIIDQMSLMGGRVHTICCGTAYSMAAVIMAFGTKGYRFGTKNSNYMIHNMSGGMQEDYIQQQVRAIDFLSNTFIKRQKEFARRLNVKYSDLEKLTNKSYWMDINGAKKLGIIDGFWSKKQEKNINDMYISSYMKEGVVSEND